MNSSRQSPWRDDANVELLRKRWHDGCTASEIAREIPGLTRNAVIGKVHRLGLPARVYADPARHTVKPRAPRPKAGRLTMHRLDAGAGIAPAPLPPPSVIDAEIPLLQRRSILQLTSDTCRFPVGDPQAAGFFYCGAAPASGRPYCAAHARRAGDGSARRPRDRRA